MQLSTEDKERIEQEANEYGRKMSDDPLHPNVLAIFHFKPGAEYATIFEREKAKTLFENQAAAWEDKVNDIKELMNKQKDKVSQLKGLLDDVLNDVQYADHKIDKGLYNEIKKALEL